MEKLFEGTFSIDKLRFSDIFEQVPGSPTGMTIDQKIMIVFDDHAGINVDVSAVDYIEGVYELSAVDQPMFDVVQGVAKIYQIYGPAIKDIDFTVEHMDNNDIQSIKLIDGAIKHAHAQIIYRYDYKDVNVD